MFRSIRPLCSIDPSPLFDLLAYDVPQAFIELALSGVIPNQQAGELSPNLAGQSVESLIEDARRFCKYRPEPPSLVTSSLITPSASSSSEVSPASSVFPTFKLPSVVKLGRSSPSGNLVESLPSLADIDKASNYFFDTVDLLVPLIDRTQFNKLKDSLRQAQEENGNVEPISMALILGVATAGLSKMSEFDITKAEISGDRVSLVGRWLEVAYHALSLSKLREAPTYDGIRSALVLASVQLSSRVSGDQSYVSAMSLLSSAVQASFALELHREPNRHGKMKYRFAECQERRRLFWGVFSLCSSVTTDTSRAWPQLDLRYIDTHFPLDCFDEELAMDELAIRASVRARVNSEIFEETPMTYNLCLARLAFVSKKISEEAFIVTGCRYSRIAPLHAELRKLEKSLPENYRVQFDDEERPLFTSRSSSLTDLKAALVQISISAEIVRLNRPFLLLVNSDSTYQKARDRAVLHAKRVLSLAIDPVCNVVLAQLSLKILSAAVVLALELVQSPDESDSETLRALTKTASDILEGQRPSSLVAAQGVNVLRFLSEQIEPLSGPGRPHAKQPRTNRRSPDELNLQLRQSWLHSIPNSTYPSRAVSPAGSDSEVVSLRRRAQRPSLKHSARSESHLPSRARIAGPRPFATLDRSHRSHSAEDFPTLDWFPRPFSPAVTSVWAPSIVAFSPVINLGEFQPHPRQNHTFADSTSGFQELDFPAVAQPSPSMFRYYQHPISTANRASYRTTLDAEPVETGLGLVDLTHHGFPGGLAVAYDEGNDSHNAMFNPNHEERMETDEVQSFHHESTGIEGYSSFDPNYRHS
ncbi:fungal specific transcription factor domain-containing protein [Sporobolomyces salmoneus]|uniref:fungal specific transcription factor domain-containing protein n=1 Tax=Sporobolomyces salmoneus TaxID=183962 RepID=UPI003178BB4B